ncbi:MAG: IS3 family transposase [Cycloclasticus sp.]|nr:IS3 family transposase [Cycloclasticus sp.]
MSNGGCYAWHCRKSSVLLAEDQRLLEQIRRIYTSSHEAYGSPRLHQALRQQGVFFGRPRVERLMRGAGLQGRVRQVYRNIVCKHPFNLKTGSMRLEPPKLAGTDQHWAADLTYIRHQRRSVYLVAVLDLYSRKIVGRSMGSRKTTELNS